VGNNRRWWLAAAVLILLADAAVSWLVAGSDAWVWVAGISFVVLVLLATTALRVALRDLRPIHLLFFGYLALLWGCWAAVGYWFPLTTLTVKPDPEGPTTATRVHYASKELPPYDRAAGLSYQLRGRVDEESLKAETQGPAGWVPRPLRVYGSTAELEKVPTVALYVDNRDHAAVEVGCGELRLAVPAGAHATHVLPAEPDGPPIRVTLDGKKVGKLEGGFGLVDVLGTRSYRFRQVAYGDGIAQFDPDFGRGTLPASTYEAAHLHRLPARVDYFLEKAPDHITVTAVFGFAPPETRGELIDAD
jgi:hypothetical protein